jgi:hypothetical protein
VFLGDDFRYISKEQVDYWYKKDVGFTIPEDDSSFRII